VKVCLLGRPGSGRETIFQALTGLTAGPSRQALRQGEALVVDARLDWLSDLFQPKKRTPARLELALPKPSGDQPLKGALEKARDADALMMVLANFPGHDGPEPAQAAAELESELLLTDYLTVSKRLERLDEDKKRGKKGDPEEAALLTTALADLEASRPLRLRPETAKAPQLRGFGLLSAKPLLAVINNPDETAQAPQLPLQVPQLTIRGRLEEEFSRLEPAEAAELMADYDLAELVGARAARTLFELTDLLTFFTVGEDECRSWPVPRGATAWEAAGQIHSDIQKGFIRAEVVSFDDFKACGGFNEAKKKGVFRLEGKTYVVADGDIVHFRFNV
jgi:ribosome-binding ATPase YchF (GTP1/OBG family)